VFIVLIEQSDSGLSEVEEAKEKEKGKFLLIVLALKRKFGE